MEDVGGGGDIAGVGDILGVEDVLVVAKSIVIPANVTVNPQEIASKTLKIIFLLPYLLRNKLLI